MYKRQIDGCSGDGLVLSGEEHLVSLDVIGEFKAFDGLEGMILIGQEDIPEVVL